MVKEGGGKSAADTSDMPLKIAPSSQSLRPQSCPAASFPPCGTGASSKPHSQHSQSYNVLRRKRGAGHRKLACFDFGVSKVNTSGMWRF